MVELDVVRSLNSSLVQSQPLVAVFFGGTGGIGQFTLRALAAAEAKGGKGLRAYIVGRNAKAAEGILADCRAVYPQGQFKFIKANDLSLISDVDRLCAELTELVEKETPDPRIDYLMVSQGGMPFQPRKDTKEGIDVTMSLMYYSRMRIITKLLPLLLNSHLPATVVSVYAAGMEKKLYADDLSLRDLKRYSYSQARDHMCYMHTLFMESLAQQHPGKLTLIHIFPGLVIGPGFHSTELPRWFRILFHWFVLPLFGRFITVPTGECGERMLSLASSERYPPRPTTDSSQSKREGAAIVGTEETPGSGVYSLTWNGESNFKAKAYKEINKQEMRKKVWDHTMKCFEVVEAGKVFTE
ncbi:uncharacterized protein Z520_01635 [Fonsecaea multimorphosa CBS 102226]|uniref:Ketoreductase (KR) domain-containing protein n=1 Tax=Fonsecaea multimorphosa CBS 102226 TaxID=1442371 RepID=A0A0D2KAZ0_9EURO|nr:uncharacterized protein Z520_01635 [Fonsecaea multimorphosa CBS 102226]KIY03168.1 hypothetical protein Z520_01635 [Fonsecaea multimorphosa CBS 102226]OAL30411.1 hypothetical protein AYO22_01609 [Fonsecaea multimorphosa]